LKARQSSRHSLCQRGFNSPSSAEGPVCTVAQLIAWQMKAQFATRDVCIITDLERPSHEQAQVINALSGKQLRDHRIWLVTPEIDTRPS
jgi:hypothetical protein